MEDNSRDLTPQPTLADAFREIERLQLEVDELTAQAEASESTGRWARWLTAAGTASVTLLAFLIPSVQEQWDRVRQKAAIEEYREVAHALLGKSHYHEAEQLLDRAIEASTETRPDLDRERLLAKTGGVNADPAWSGKISDELSEEDFVTLEAMLERAHDQPALSWTHNNHAVFLAAHGQRAQALEQAQRAVRLQPTDARPYVTLGNLQWDEGSLATARRSYESALVRDANNLRAHYDLGILLESMGDVRAASRELQRVLALDPADAARDDLARVEAAVAERAQRTAAPHSS
jgi:tetratricopeptide (TPR) repeat protein